MTSDGGLVSGVIDLDYKIDGVWTVVNFRTDEVWGSILGRLGFRSWGLGWD